MKEEIPIRPNVPENLRLAAAQRQLVPFIGAGVSFLAGYPNWDELADKSLKFFLNKKLKFAINHAQLDQILKLPARTKISLALELERKNKTEINFREILRSSSDKRSIGDKAYAEISKLSQFSKNFVTTNYDEELDEPTPKKLEIVNVGDFEGSEVERSSKEALSDKIKKYKPIYKLEDLHVGCLNQSDTVLHIHGSVNDRDSMILSTTDYLQRYYGHRINSGNELKENPYLILLGELFNQRNILFIGYGLNELDILEYVIQKGLNRKRRESGEKNLEALEAPRHFILQGFFSHELELARSLESYYLSFGIELIPFSRDSNNWEGMVDAIKYIAEELPVGTDIALAEKAEMRGLLE